MITNDTSKWRVTLETGADLAPFTTFIEIEVTNEGQTLSYPVEAGSFVDYNKVQTPLEISITAARQGDETDFSAILETLDDNQAKPTKLFITTPSSYYGPMTLERYDYRRTVDNGAGLLLVNMNFVEVKEAQTQVTTTVITKPKNPSSANKTDTGQTQTDDKRSVAKKALDKIFG